MEACKRVMKKYLKLMEQRPDPEDTLYNIAQSLDNCGLNEEGYANFYDFISTQNRDDWHYRPLQEIHTLGDLSAEEIKQIDDDLQAKLSELPCKFTTEASQNGIETFVNVKCVPNKQKEHGKRLAGFCKGLPQEASGPQPQGHPQESLCRIQEEADEKSEEKREG